MHEDGREVLGVGGHLQLEGARVVDLVEQRLLVEHGKRAGLQND